MSYTKNWCVFLFSLIIQQNYSFSIFFKGYQCLSTRCFVSGWNMFSGNEINLKPFYEMASRTNMFWRNCIGGIFFLVGENANLTTEVFYKSVGFISRPSGKKQLEQGRSPSKTLWMRLDKRSVCHNQRVPIRGSFFFNSVMFSIGAAAAPDMPQGWIVARANQKWRKRLYSYSMLFLQWRNVSSWDKTVVAASAANWIGSFHDGSMTIHTWNLSKVRRWIRVHTLVVSSFEQVILLYRGFKI